MIKSPETANVIEKDQTTAPEEVTKQYAESPSMSANALHTKNYTLGSSPSSYLPENESIPTFPENESDSEQPPYTQKEEKLAVFRQVCKWIEKDTTLNLRSYSAFKDLYDEYTKDCDKNNIISYSKKKFSTLFKWHYRREFRKGAMTVENRGGVKIFGVILKKDYEDEKKSA